MAFRTFIIVGLLFLIHSCAQVGTLTGGEKDIIAPIPIASKMNPENGSTNFTTSVIKIPFSEYVKLNNPEETIVIIPPHAKLDTKLSRKTVSISWNDTLKNNTTYTIYLNGTIKDLTEGNDSLMQYVFSTGNFIDSISYQVKVIDAFSNQPKKNCLVGLYEGATDSVRPTYFVKTDEQGLAKFAHLKEGEFSLLAFEDTNKDMLLQLDEKVAFKKEKIILTPSVLDSNSLLLDSIPLRLFKPEVKPRLNSITYKAPGMFLIGSTHSLINSKFSVNNSPLDKKQFELISSDSLRFFYHSGDSANVVFSATSELFTDTISLRLLKKEKEGKLSFSNNLIDNFLFPTDTLTISFSDIITEFDTTLFTLVNAVDSTKISYNKILFKRNQLFLLFTKDKIKAVEFNLLPNTIKTVSTTLKDSVKLNFQLKKDTDFGTIKLDASAYSGPIVVEVMLGGKTIRSIPLHDKKATLIEQLVPGDYSFKVIIDENKNGKWDTGNRKLNYFPEKLLTFSEITKVRANWEIDIKLTAKPY